MVTVVQLKALQIFDSRGIPTIEATLTLSDGSKGVFKTPSGASTGKKEACELRDFGPEYKGRGVSKAIANIHGPIKNAVVEKSFNDIHDFDRVLIDLDGTFNKSNLGANALLAVSGAFFRAFCQSKKRCVFELFDKPTYTLPTPLINVLNGGAHADNGLDIQEFMLVPCGKTFKDSLRIAAECFYELKSILLSKGLSSGVGDEGGFAPRLKSNEEALKLLSQAVERAGYKLSRDVFFALDVAANEMYEDEKDQYRFEGGLMGREELLDWYKKLSANYPICSIEDPFYEEDYQGFIDLTKQCGDGMQIVGDDLFVTNKKYIEAGVKDHWANAVLIKMNQVGTISETMDAVSFAKRHHFNTIASHRSGETEDTTLADLALLLECSQIKTGSMARSERLAKYNRLLSIENDLAGRALYLGNQAFSNR